MNDEFEDVRAARAVESEIDAVVGRSRHLFLAGLVDEQTARSRSTRGWLIGGGIGVAAAATAVAVVVAMQPAPGPAEAGNPTPSASASPVPSQSAAPTPTPTPQPTLEPSTPPQSPPTAQTVLAQVAEAVAADRLADGQYRKVSIRLSSLTPYRLIDGQAPDWNVARDEADGAFVAITEWNRYVTNGAPADWVDEFLPTLEIGDGWGADHEQVAEQWRAQFGDRETFVVRDFPRDVLLQVGSFDDLSRDPDTLLAQIQSHIESTAEPGDRESVLMQTVLRALEYNIGPKDLRVALLQVAGMLPTAELTGVDGDVATLQWTAERDGEVADRFVLTVDMTTGFVTTWRWWIGDDGDVVPADVPWATEEITVSTVDEAPAG